MYVRSLTMQKGRKYGLEIEVCEQIQNVHKSEKTKSHNTPMEESNTAKTEEGPGSEPQGGREGRRISTKLRNR